MSSGQNQYVQWGIPTKLFNPTKVDPVELDYSNPSQFEKAVLEELKWLEDNKHYIAADKSMLKFQGYDNSVGDNAEYIIHHGLKIYGLRITGPSSELSKLDSFFDIRMENVIDIDFYYWK